MWLGGVRASGLWPRVWIVGDRDLGCSVLGLGFRDCRAWGSSQTISGPLGLHKQVKQEGSKGQLEAS